MRNTGLLGYCIIIIYNEHVYRQRIWLLCYDFETANGYSASTSTVDILFNDSILYLQF